MIKLYLFFRKYLLYFFKFSRCFVKNLRDFEKNSVYNKGMLMKREFFILLIYYSFFLINVDGRYFKIWSRFVDCIVLKYICCVLLLRCFFIDI